MIFYESVYGSFQLENLSIQDYIDKAQNIANLHHQITECDSILEVSIYNYCHENLKTF